MTKFRRLNATLAITLLAASGASLAMADDWPAWRGSQRDGICRETGLLQQWPAEGPKLLWKATGLGEGYSGPAIVGKVLYTMGSFDGKEWIIALDTEAGGRLLWQTPIGPIEYDGYCPGARSTPTTDGDRVYGVGASGRLACLDRASGKLLWSKSYVADFGGTVPRWAYAESVLIDGNLLLCTPGGPKATLAALDKATGRTEWASTFGDLASYSSIVKASAGGIDQYVAFTADGVVGVDARDGKLLWRYKEPDHSADWGDVNVATPIWSEGTVFAASNYGVGGGMAKIEKTPDGFRAEQVYFTKDMKNHHGGMILLGGALYGCNDPGILMCLDYRTGKVLWHSRTPGKCSLLCAEGMLYCRSETGPICLVEATPKGFNLKGRFDQPDRSDQKSWPHPVIAHGKLYLRDQDVLLCYDVRARQPAR